MNPTELTNLLNELIATWENEVVEFKQAGNDYKTDTLGEYFSALSNEANLRGANNAWLVFGIHNTTRAVVGTNYRQDEGRLQGLKLQITESTEPSITLRNIYVLAHPQGRVVLFEIPPAPRGMPIAWKGHYYARAGESLTSLGLDKQDEIRQQTRATDWSAHIVPQATVDDLDTSAVQKAREAFALKHANRFAAGEVMAWSVVQFLDRARITQNGNITRTALLLLGKAEAAYYLSPHPVQMTWKLAGAQRAYEHFGAPFFLTSTALYQKIRNIQLRLLPLGQMVPHEIAKYDQKMVLEALHNCIAHQDYERYGRIVVIEQADRLIFENEGGFFEGVPEDYQLGGRVPHRYRNAFLIEAMLSLNMIDKMGFGIQDMYRAQAKRYLPMPDYDVSSSTEVRLIIYGGEVDQHYTQMLMLKTDLLLADVLALDRVQKKLPIPDDAVNRLRRGGLIEGRKPHFHVSAMVAAATGNKADYIRNRTQDDTHYAKLLSDYLEKFNVASRAEINSLLMSKLSDVLSDSQKTIKINTLLTKFRRSGLIKNQGSDRSPQWVLAEKNSNLQRT